MSSMQALLTQGFDAQRDAALFDAEQIKAFVAEQVLPYKKIREVVEVELLPTSAAGKVLKTDLRSRLLESVDQKGGSR